MDDPGGQSAAINLGIAQAQRHHEYVNWLGDDDTLTQGSLAAVSAALDAVRPRRRPSGSACTWMRTTTPVGEQGGDEPRPGSFPGARTWSPSRGS